MKSIPSLWKLPGFNCWLHHSLALWSLAVYLTSPCLRFLKIRITNIMLSEDCCEVWVNIWKALRTVPGTLYAPYKHMLLLCLIVPFWNNSTEVWYCSANSNILLESQYLPSEILSKNKFKIFKLLFPCKWFLHIYQVHNIFWSLYRKMINKI